MSSPLARNTTTESVLLDVDHVALSLPTAKGRLEALSDVVFSLKRGETYALVGESGCGKSLTAATIMRLLPDGATLLRGDIRFEGVSLPALSEGAMRTWRGRRIAMVFQEPATALNPVMTIGHQIEEVLRQHTQLCPTERKARVRYWLERTGLPEPELTARKFPHELSGGQKQRIVIAMALAGEPDLVIADEPTTALDVTLQAQILQLLKALQKEQGLTILLITHDLAVVRETADRLSLFYAGETLETASVKAFFEQPLHPYAKALFGALPKTNPHEALTPIEGQVPSLAHPPQGCRFAARCPRATSDCVKNAPRWQSFVTATGETRWCRCTLVDRSLVAQKQSDVVARPSAHERTENDHRAPVLQLEHLSVRFGARLFGPKPRATVDDVSFSLYPGETLALVGESGSGKTTTALATLGLLGRGARCEGTLLLGNERLSLETPWALRAIRQHVQMVFQDPFSSLDPRMTVGEAIEEGIVALRPNWDRDERRARVQALLEAVGLPSEVRDRLPHEFSGGQRQRIAIARALAPKPRVLILDEPTSALDVSVQAQILNLLKRLQATEGLSYLFITHNFAVVNYMADRMAVMKNGQVVETGATQAILRHPQNAYTKRLLESIPSLCPQDHLK